MATALCLSATTTSRAQPSVAADLERITDELFALDMAPEDGRAFLSRGRPKR